MKTSLDIVASMMVCALGLRLLTWLEWWDASEHEQMVAIIVLISISLARGIDRRSDEVSR